MATMMPPAMFNMPPSSSGPSSFRQGSGPPALPPPVFNTSMPPPSFNPSGEASTMVQSKPGESGNLPATGGNPNSAPTTGANSTSIGPPGFQQRQYRFKPTATMNLAEAEGYGRRLRRNMAQVRRHIDAIASVQNYVEDRIWQSGHWLDQRASQPHILYGMDSTTPNSLWDKPVDCVTTKFVRSAMNKVKCPIYDVCWTPEGRRLITGASSGEFTLWNGTAFNFETILQAHDTAVRALKWSHNDLWMISADHDGFIKYWQANMNNVTMFQAHKEAVRSVSFCPSDVKFATASDDGTVRVWDFIRCHEERILRGHGSDVRCVDWHPRKSLLVSGSRDSQQPIKLWDPKSGQCLATLHDHKNAATSALWNDNGNWLVTGSRDHLVKVYDIRMMKEIMTFRGHKKEVTALSWHPVHEGLLVSGGADGALMFWLVTNDKEIGIIENAHEQAIWTLKWHPLGHILASGSNDNNTKFWARNKAGDALEDFYFIANAYDHQPQQRFQALSAAPQQQQQQPTADKAAWEMTPATTAVTSAPSKPEQDPRRQQAGFIPGMGLEGEMFEKLREQQAGGGVQPVMETGGIPGLGGVADPNDPMGPRKPLLKQPPPKKAQRQFERVWNVNSMLPGAMMGGDDDGGPDSMDFRKPKPSLLGGGPQQTQPAPPATLLTSSGWPDQQGRGGDSWRQQGQGPSGGFPADHQRPSRPMEPPENMESKIGGPGQWQHGDVDLRQSQGGAGWASSGRPPYDDRSTNARDPRMQTRVASQQQQTQHQQQSEYRYQNWMHGGSGPQQQQDPRRPVHQQPQPLLSLTIPAPNGMGGMDSDQDGFGGMGRGGQPTNPKRKWKQEYEAEEAQGTTKRWALSTGDDSPPTSSNIGDRDDRQMWPRQGGPAGRR